ncbi:MAG: hypothetical protein RLZZ444_1452 [Pseudomonadota bacterium]|jgi:AraC-like DNA-binding protein
MLETALLYDAAGRPIRQDHRTRSRDWDEVQAFCRDVYMPYRVRPVGKLLKPDATMLAARVNRITVTRFSYGVPIHLSEFDAGAGNILVLNTIAGGLRHMVDKQTTADTVAGESFVTDCSRTDYWLDGDASHMQLNLTVPHALMEEMAFRYFGFVPDDRLWQSKLKFGGQGSAWIALLDYVARAIAQSPREMEQGRIGAHLEETICLELLRQWAAGAGLSLETAARQAAPHYVRAAEEFMRANARQAPTVSEVADHCGVSVRSLSGGFRQFRGISPSAFLRDMRLCGIRDELLACDRSTSVTTVASQWGYLNFGMFASAYRRRFGELPSETLAASRRFRHSRQPQT